MKYHKLYENWNRHLNEDSGIQNARQVVIEYIKNKSVKADKALLNEMSVSVNADDGIQLQTDFMKWATYAGMTSTVVGGAVTVAAMYAPWTSFLLLLVPAAAAMMSSPIVMAIAGFLVFRFSWTRKLAKNIIGWLGGDGMKAAIKAAEEAVQKMIDSSNGELDKKSAWELFKLLATTVINNKEFRSKLSEFKEAIKGKNEEVIAKINDEMDALVEKIVQQDILNSNEKEEDANIEVDGEQEIEEAHPMGDPEPDYDIDDETTLSTLFGQVKVNFDQPVAMKVALEYLSDLRNGTDEYIKQHELCKAIECSVGVWAAKQLDSYRDKGDENTSTLAEQKYKYNKLYENWNKFNS